MNVPTNAESSDIVRQAATVMLLRPAAGGFEAFLVRRSTRSSFAPDAYVFPGGAIDAADASSQASERTLGLDPARLRAEFRESIEPAVAAAISIAALRELFEEAGVLFAVSLSGDALHDPGALSDARRRLRDDPVTFADVLRDLNCRADARALTFFSRWITPPGEPRRYDTHFFLARMPEHQTPLADADETHDGRWLSPRDALGAHARGEMHLVYPTIKHLERLATFDDLDALAAFARDKPIVTVAPYALPQNGFKIPPELENAW